MNWTVGLILCVGILLPVGIGAGLGAYRAVQSPAVLAGLAGLLVKTLLPILKEFALKRNSPEIEKRMQEVIRRGGQWDNFSKRERLNPR